MRSSVPSGSSCEQPAGSSGKDAEEATDGAGLETAGVAEMLGVMVTLGVGVGVGGWTVGEPTVQPLNAKPPSRVAATITARNWARPIAAAIAAGYSLRPLNAGTSAVAARQLATKLLELRVGRQAAGRSVGVGCRQWRLAVCRCRGRGRGRRRRGRRGTGVVVRTGRSLGLLGLNDLALVRFKTRPRLGVLTLPLDLLLLVTRKPLVGLGVEAVGVDVVSGFVVVGRHAVERRVEVAVGCARVAAGVLVRLLQRQADPTTLEVDVDDLHEDLVADLHDLLGDFDMPLSQLGDVHETFDALFDAHERTERNQLRDLAWHDLTDRVGARERLPRVFLG